jgi:hypothetical protein
VFYKKNKNNMNLKDSQLDVDNWIKEHGVRYFNELTNMAQLTEEVEVAQLSPVVTGTIRERKR